ncbi:MAG: hypothetical protein HDQ96_09390 [Lachnospiraceae bacterium]|nr:hypothetical protein [Lachnospiraceae bacterium]
MAMANVFTVGVTSINAAFQINDVSMFVRGQKELGAPTGNQYYDYAKQDFEILSDVVCMYALANPRLYGDAAKNYGLIESDKGMGSGLDVIIKNGRVSIDDIKDNPSAFSGKSAEEIGDVLKNSGYDVTIETSTRSRSGAQIIQINNTGGSKNISQVQVSPGGGRHGIGPYVKISTTDQGIIKIVDGIESTYITDGKETATIIFSGGN